MLGGRKWSLIQGLYPQKTFSVVRNKYPVLVKKEQCMSYKHKTCNKEVYDEEPNE